MKQLIIVFLAAAFAMVGCRTRPIIATPELLLGNSAAAMWRLRIDGVAYVFIGGISGTDTEVKKITPFFLVPENEFDSMKIVFSLERDGASVRVGGVVFSTPQGTTISDSRIYLFIQNADHKWTLREVSAPLPQSATRLEILTVLGACLSRRIEEPNQRPRHNAGAKSFSPPTPPSGVVHP